MSAWSTLARTQRRSTARPPRRPADACWAAGCGAVALAVTLGVGTSRPAAAQAIATTVFQPVVAAPMIAQPMTAFRPVVAAPVMPASTYVANYTPAGNYAAVTAFSPPVVAAAPSVIGVRTAYAPVMPATVPLAPVATTAFYAPPAVMPTTAFYAPAVAAPVATVAYSMPAPVATPVFAAPVVAAPVVAAPVTAYYPPLYRRGLFGAYRPVSPGYFLSY